MARPTEPIVARLQATIDANRRCSGGLLARARAFAVDRGPSGGPEALAFLADDAFADNFWYGHVRRHPVRTDAFVALLVWTYAFVNADTVPLLFRRFRYWTTVRGKWQPCTTERDGDAYAEGATFGAAVEALAAIVGGFDPEARAGRMGTPQYEAPIEFRIMDVMSFGESIRRGKAEMPPVPMASAPSLVRDPA